MKDKLLNDFACHVFDKKKMKERLPDFIYKRWKEALRLNETLDSESADYIANAMKMWAVENDCHFYTHWFQPLNGLSANKQDSFLDRDKDSKPILNFSGKNLIKGEPDASSFPTGGIRSTFEARGYTYWDLSAYSFILDGCLYIPTIFVSFKGEKIDKRYPLISSMKNLSVQACRITNLFNKTQYSYRAKTKVGLEQEFFLIDKKLADSREDIKNLGMTVLGQRALKQQEFEDHYFANIPKRVKKFYREVNEKLYKLGIYAKTEHNEVAPCQFELAVMYENSNVAVDHNLLVIKILTEVASDNGLYCLLKEKPFKGVNGSGKHNNFSILTNYGLNCFDPGNDISQNKIFLAFVIAMIRSCHKYQSLLRISSSNTTNDLRLEEMEAPPAIISVYLGDDIEDVLKKKAYQNYESKTHDNTLTFDFLGEMKADLSDRNRTSPIAFTGNKFEFRMLASSKSAADLNIVINAAMTESLRIIADRLENCDDIDKELDDIIRNWYIKHKNILFNGDGYSDKWKDIAKKRGLYRFKTLSQALYGCINNKEYELLIRENILTKKELKALYDITQDEIINYSKLTVRSILNMVSKDVESPIIEEITSLSKMLSYVKNQEILKRRDKLNDLLSQILKKKEELHSLYRNSESISDKSKACLFFETDIRNAVDDLRNLVDLTEELLTGNYRFASYNQMFLSLE